MGAPKQASGCSEWHDLVHISSELTIYLIAHVRTHEEDKATELQAAVSSMFPVYRHITYRRTWKKGKMRYTRRFSPCRVKTVVSCFSRPGGAGILWSLSWAAMDP